MKYLAHVLVCCWSLSAISVWASCNSAQRLTGINLAGAEFNPDNLPGELHKDYFYPSTHELEQLASFGINTIRLPIRWERIRPSNHGSLNESELQQIKATYNTAKRLKLCLIIDLHNYAKYYSTSLALNVGLHAAFTDTWLRIASALPDTQHVALGLMNEPIHMPVREWGQLAQSTLLKLRQQKHGHLVLVAGGRWSGAHDWFGSYLQQSNAEVFEDFYDPMNNYVLEIHQYADHNYSGTSAYCKKEHEFNDMFNRVSDWANTHDQPLFLGEFGVADNPQCLETLDRFLDLTRAKPWRGWTYWAAGRWWGNYALAISMKSMNDSPQWKILKPYFHNGH